MAHKFYNQARFLSRSRLPPVAPRACPAACWGDLTRAWKPTWKLKKLKFQPAFLTSPDRQSGLTNKNVFHFLIAPRAYPENYESGVKQCFSSVFLDVHSFLSNFSGDYISYCSRYYIWGQQVLNFSVSFRWMRVLKNCYIKVGGSVLLKEKRQSNSVRCMFNIIYNGSQHDGKVRLCKLKFSFFRFVIQISGPVACFKSVSVFVFPSWKKTRENYKANNFNK